MPKDSFTQLAEKLLSLLESQNGIVDFLKPVNWKKLGLLDYPKIIKTPMSIFDIRQKLKKSQYSNFNQVIKDLNLIWSNCRDYNEEKSAIVKNANKLDSFCRAFCTEKLNLPKKRGKIESEEEDSESANIESDEMDKEEENVEKIVIKDVKVEDLVTLKEKVAESNLATLNKVIWLAKKRCANSLRYDGDNIIITLEKLTYETYMEIRKLVYLVPETNDELVD